MTKRNCATIFILLGLVVLLHAQWPGFYGAPSGSGIPRHTPMPQGGFEDYRSLYAPMPQGGFGGGQMFPGGAPFQNGFSLPVPSRQTPEKVAFTSSNLPLVLIDTHGRRITQQEKITASMRIVDGGPNRRNAPADTALVYDGRIGIKVRGNSSVSFEQKRYTFETRDEKGTALDVALLNLPPENDFVLLGPYNDISMMRDVLAFHLWNEMGHWGPHTCYVEMMLNGSYQGVYVLTETIKRTKNRLDIAKLKPEDNDGVELTGGYIVRIDAFDGDDLTFPSAVRSLSPGQSGMQGAGMSGMSMGSGGAGMPGMFGMGGMSGMGGFGSMSSQVTWTCVYPDKDDITEAQFRYIRDFVNRTERAIEAGDYASCIDVSSFVDYFIHTELSLNADAYKRSAYFYKTKQHPDGTGGKLHAGSVWDYNLAYGNCSFCNAGDIRARAYEGCETNPTPPMWKTLASDAAFMSRVRTRYAELRRTVLSKASLNRFIDRQAALLDEAKDRHFAQYDDLLQPAKGGSSNNPWGWSIDRPGATSWYAAYTVSSYAEEIGKLKQWLSDRLDVLDAQWLGGQQL